MLAFEGFLKYAPRGEVWAHAIQPSEIDSHFPAGGFIGSWGGRQDVAAGDVLVMPFPDGKEIYVVREALFDDAYSLSQSAAQSATETPGSESEIIVI